MTKNFWT